MPSAQGSVAVYLTYWLEKVASTSYARTPTPATPPASTATSSRAWAKKKLTKLTAKDVRTWLNQLRTTCQCCPRGIDAQREEPRCCPAGPCYHKLLFPLTLTYIHSVLKSALEHAVR